MNHLLKEGPLLNEKGNLVEAGYSTQLIKKYNRKDIKANKLKIKEWDYYYVGNDKYGIALTVGDNSYIASISVSFLDFTKPSQITKSKMLLFTMGKLNLPSTSVVGDVIVNKKGCTFKFLIEGDKRHLIVNYPKFDNNKEFKCDIYLKQTNRDSMVIATPFNKPKHFYYNQKINLLLGSGTVTIGDTNYDFNNTYGVLDWGRGVWTYKNTWYWSSLNSVINNKPIGFNLGYGFGDTSASSENMFFYNDRSYKLDDVIFDIPKDKKGRDDFLSPWRIYSKDQRIDLIFTPIINRSAHMSVLVIKSIQDQVFGTFKGTITINNDEKIEIPNLLGFAEKVTNHW